MVVGIGVLGYLLFFYITKLRGNNMQLQSLKLLHFRNYEHLEIKFHPKINIIYGKNGSGKTNLVEAIYVLAVTRSFRNVNEKVLIQSGGTLGKIEGEIVNNDEVYPTNYRIYLEKDGKKVKINKNKIVRLSDYITKIPIVLFSPDDLKFLKDTPSTRRKQLNISISQYSLEYLKNLSNYNKLLKQRNAYLKKLVVNSNQSFEYLNILTEKLIGFGIKIYEEREQFILKINETLGDFYRDITGLSGLKIGYKSDYEGMSKETLLKSYQHLLKKDLMFGKTNLGIHTDDLHFFLNDEDLRDYGSEGQQKNAIIAYKLSELELLKEILGYFPILILDDLFSELDREKIENIFKILKSDVQTFITTTDLDVLERFGLEEYKSFEIEDGQVVKESKHERRRE